MSVPLEEIEEVFSIFDNDHDGKVTREEVPDMFRALGKAPTHMEVKDILEACKEQLDLAAFKNIWRDKGEKLREPEDLIDDMYNCFRACDREGSGMIHEAELKQTLTTLGDAISSADMERLLRGVTIGSDGNVDYEAFVKHLVEDFPVGDI